MVDLRLSWGERVALTIFLLITFHFHFFHSDFGHNHSILTGTDTSVTQCHCWSGPFLSLLSTGKGVFINMIKSTVIIIRLERPVIAYIRIFLSQFVKGTEVSSRVAVACTVDIGEWGISISSNIMKFH